MLGSFWGLGLGGAFEVPSPPQPELDLGIKDRGTLAFAALAAKFAGFPTTWAPFWEVPTISSIRVQALLMCGRGTTTWNLPI